MALNRDKIGAVYPAYVYEVSREKIREYAIAVGETDPRYLGNDPDVEMVAPPTFAAAFTVIMGGEAAFADPDLGTHPALVHGNQRYAYGERPMRPGDRLICTPRIVAISARAGNELLVLEVDCRFEDDDALAVRSETTLIFLGSGVPAKES